MSIRNIIIYNGHICKNVDKQSCLETLGGGGGGGAPRVVGPWFSSPRSRLCGDIPDGLSFPTNNGTNQLTWHQNSI